MNRRTARIVLNLDVELKFGDRVILAVSQDVTPFGMFVRMEEPLPLGTSVELTIAPHGVRLSTPALIVHQLVEAEAHTLGRRPGNGILFRGEPTSTFVHELERLIEAHPQVTHTDDELRIVVADSSTRLLERLSTALDNAGFSVATATNGMEALGASLSRPPDVILAERDMPVLDGLHLLSELGRHPQLAAVPVILMAEAPTDLQRLEALQLGAVEIIPKPFTALEVILRARRVGLAGRREAERVVLRGSIDHVGLPSLLQMLEQDRETGLLRLSRDELVAWLSLIDGRVVRARSSDLRGDSRSTLMRILNWTSGHFELTTGNPEGEVELSDSITHLLLEHARVRDESMPS